jgi:hypothetical protein
MTNVQSVVKETKESFDHKVTEYVIRYRITHFDAVKKITEENEYEPEFVAKLLTPSLKKKIEKELRKRNMLK